MTGRLSGRPVLLLAILVTGSVSACDAPVLDGGRPLLELEREDIRLERGTALHEVRLGAAAAAAGQVDTVAAQTGDVVRFATADGRTHAITFAVSDLRPEARAFLERTEQLRGPPLIRTGAAWVVSLERAPPGAYPFTCLLHHDHGVIVVAPE